MDEKYIEQRAIDLLNNPKVKNNIEKYNYSMEIPEEYNFGEVGPVDERIFFLMNQLGIPIGTELVIDSKGNDVYEWSDVPYEEIKNIFVPINNFKEYEDFVLKHEYVHMMVNPDYMKESQVRNIAYLLEFANDDRFFDFYTMNNLQMELLDSAPLNYESAMKIFKKYYTESVCKKFIIDYEVEKERFYYLSGLEEKKNITQGLKNFNRSKNIVYER